MKRNRFKWLGLLMLISLIVFGAVNVSAAQIVDSGKCGKNLTWTLDSDGLLTISGYGEMDDYSYVSDVPWYDNKSNINSVVIENGVTSICSNAFNGSINLKSVEFSSEMKSIGSYAFYWCTNLTNVEIPDSVSDIGMNAFAECDCLTSFKIPNGVTTIERGVLLNCSSLSSVKIPECVTTIGDAAFMGCSSLHDISIPEGVTTIGINAFSGSGLVSVKIPDSVKLINSGTFRFCDFLENVDIPKGVISIYNEAFYDCKSLRNITIPDGVTTIGDGVFCFCSNLESVILGNGVKTIGNDAFKWCYNLKAVTIPNSILSISEDAFGYCHSLKNVYYGGSKKQATNILIGGDNDYLNEATWHYDVCVHTYENDCDANCNLCGAYRNIYHDLVLIMNKVVTCTEDGYTGDMICIKCNELVQLGEVIKAFGHDWSSWKVTKEVTCTTNGQEERYCNVCEECEVNQIKETGHQAELKDVKEATCTKDGYTGDMICVKCKAIEYKGEVIKAMGHDWTEWKTVKEPTFETTGCQKRECKVCKITEEKDVPVLFHTPELRDLKEATCTEDGYTGDMVCTKCHEIVQEGEVIVANGHDWFNWKVIEQATCTVNGKEEHQCRTCNEIENEIIKATGHTWSFWKVVKEPTYDAEGKEERTCQNCSDKESRAIAKLEKELVDNPFTDVEEDEYYYKPVLWAFNNKVTTGTSATEFSPDQKCTRAQIVTFLWRAMGCPEPNATNNPFTDVKVSEYYGKAVLWAVENGITNGTSKDKFSSDAECTRAQIVTFLWRAMGSSELESADNPFTDVKTKEYYGKAVLWAVENGITTGTGTGKFAPDETCTRGQVVTFLYRSLNSQDFDAKWYKKLSYYESQDNENLIEISFLDNGCIQIILDGLSVFDCWEDEYIKDSYGGYVYEGDKFGSKLIYYPNLRNSISVTYKDESKLYYPIDEDEFYAKQDDGKIEDKEEYPDETFDAKWYKKLSYYESQDNENLIEISFLDNGCIQIILDGLSVFDCWEDEYIRDSNGGYVYEGDKIGSKLIYYPNFRNSINVTYKDESKLYYPIDEDEFYAKQESGKTDDNNKVEFSDAEIYAAARLFMMDAISDTNYYMHNWKFIKNVNITKTIMGGYTATLYVYSDTLKSYKYLHVTMLVDWQGKLYFSSGSM